MSKVQAYHLDTNSKFTSTNVKLFSRIKLLFPILYKVASLFLFSFLCFCTHPWLENYTSLTHLSLIPHIYALVNWASTASGNGLSLVRCQAITWTNADLLSIGLLGTTLSENWIEILTFSFKKMWLKLLSAKWRPYCPGGDDLILPCWSIWLISNKESFKS